MTFIQNAIVFKDKSLFVPEHDPELIKSYSISLTPQNIAEVCGDITGVEELLPYGKKYAARISLLVEECLSNIVKQADSKSILADIDICSRDDGFFIRIVDDGAAYNSFCEMNKQERIDNDLLEEAIILGMSENATYDRVIDMNHITMLVRYPQPCEAAAQVI